MSEPFDRVATATSENPEYLESVALVATAWRKFFPGIAVSVAFVTERDESDPLVRRMAEFADVRLYRPMPGVPVGNLAKVSRYLVAAEYPYEVSMIVDADTAPLQRAWYLERTAMRRPGHLLAMFGDAYKDTSHAGKFPAHGTTAEGHLFRRLLPPHFLAMARGLRLMDHKEALTCGSDTFSDESLVRALIRMTGVPVQYVPQPVAEADRIDRSNWHLDADRLAAGGYVETNLPRPLSAHWEHVAPIASYLYGRDVTMADVVLS